MSWTPPKRGLLKRFIDFLMGRGHIKVDKETYELFMKAKEARKNG